MLSIYFIGVLSSFLFSLLVNRITYLKYTLDLGYQPYYLVLIFALMSFIGLVSQILFILWHILTNEVTEEKISNLKIVKFLEGR
jgi:ABC-type protease/lipase transport system fused ATPase/permease subunit